ncbi:MAG: RNA polymerase factor sigma-54 [Ferruginibacter sp.]
MLNQSQLQKQNMKILPQQIQMLGIYHLNMMDLEQRIKDELDENPLLEKTLDEEVEASKADLNDPPQEFQNWDEYGYDDIPNYSYENQSYIHNDSINLPIRDTIDFRTGLKQQLINIDLDEQEKNLAAFILDCISDNGYLERSIPEVADDYSFINKTFVNEKTVEEVLIKIQELEPPGIASRSIQEFILVQLNLQKHGPIVKKAIQLVKDHYNSLQKKNFDKICASLSIDEEELAIILSHIAKLQLSPLNIGAENNAVKDTIIPDFILMVEGDSLVVELSRQKSNTLYINDNLIKDLEQASVKTSDEKASVQYLKSKLSSAQWFIDAIRQREDNMLLIMRAIIKKQRDYFLSGDIATLEPMILKNIAEEVGLDISTVSRVTCNKYIDTPFGLVLLKDLFTEGIVNEEGVSVSNKVVQIRLKEIIESEDRNSPYNDQQLVKKLGEKGIRIARRTIAKYRDLMNIPVGNMRRIWSKTS